MRTPSTVFHFQHQITSLVLFASLCCIQTGCELREQTQATAFHQHDSEQILTILLDLSGSYADLMAEDGRAYRFTLRVIDRYFRDRIGSDDKIIIGQLSDSDTPMLWEGTPSQLRREFPTADAFREFLVSHSHPAGSRIHDSIADTLDYLLDYPGVTSGKTQSAVFVLSDMLDTTSDSEESKDRMLGLLAAYGRQDVSVGLYWVHQSLVLAWRTHLQDAGIRRFVVESEIVADPPLPSFE